MLMNILFVCKANVGRSQMAESWFGVLSKHNVKSAGTNVNGDEGKELHEYVIGCMKELRCDLSGHYRKQLTREAVGWADKIYVMTGREDFPSCFNKNLPNYIDYSKVEFWAVDDPKGKSYESHVKTMTKVKGLVEKLVREIG